MMVLGPDFSLDERTKMTGRDEIPPLPNQGPSPAQPHDPSSELEQDLNQ